MKKTAGMKERNLDHRIDEVHVDEPIRISRFEAEQENIRLQEEAEGVRIATEIVVRAFAIHVAAAHEARMGGFSSSARIFRNADSYARYILTGAHPE
jgi:hypothetical protein